LNFGYSFIFGLLSGNSNILKIPSKDFPQAQLLCKIIDNLLRKEVYKCLFNKTAFIKYDKDNNLTQYFSSFCDSRVIWGGDSTIDNVRQFKTPVRSIDIAFADRYSICVINTDKLSNLNGNDLLKVAEKLYNDTFLVDQNACSSPHLLIWLGKKKKETINNFWRVMKEYVYKNYEMESFSIVDKYTKLCHSAIGLSDSFDLKGFDELIYRVALHKIPHNIHEFRGNCGFFLNTRYLALMKFAI